MEEKEAKEVEPKTHDSEQESQQSKTEHPETDLKEKLEHLENKLKSSKEEVLKGILEMQNMRVRHEMQIEETKKYCLANIAKEMANIMDSILMALQNDKDSLEALKRTVEGIELTKKQLEDLFKKFKIQKIEPKVTEDFDYEMHHAISQVKDSGQKENTIVKVIQVGYALEDRLIRPALVSVAS